VSFFLYRVRCNAASHLAIISLAIKNKNHEIEMGLMAVKSDLRARVICTQCNIFLSSFLSIKRRVSRNLHFLLCWVFYWGVKTVWDEWNQGLLIVWSLTSSSWNVCTPVRQPEVVLLPCATCTDLTASQAASHLKVAVVWTGRVLLYTNRIL
jgi:hypothetical protein